MTCPRAQAEVCRMAAIPELVCLPEGGVHTAPRSKLLGDPPRPPIRGTKTQK